MTHKVIVLGCGGHGKVIADIILSSGDEIIGFLDDGYRQERFLDFPVLGICAQYVLYPEAEFIVAIGNADVREKLVSRMQNVRWYTAIHPTAYVSPLSASSTRMVHLPQLIHLH